MALTTGDKVLIGGLAFLAFGLAYWLLGASLGTALLAGTLGAGGGGLRVYLARQSFR